MRNFILLIFLGFGYALSAQDIAIIPAPASIKPGKGHFTLNASTRIKLEGSGLEPSAHFLNDYLQQFYGFKLSTAPASFKGATIVLNYERMDQPIAGAYRMNISNNEIYIAGDNATGVFYGIQSLLQLLPVKPAASLLIPQLKIEDHPRFAYRGLHLDVGRHFFPVDYIKKYLDFIAMHKMNYFHWHLTEDQGWRIEIKKYPLLTQIGSCRDGTVIGRNTGVYDSLKYCGFYTQDQIREVLQYAKDRYITVIPEIELPGHAAAALAAYPYLGCTGGPYTVQQRWGVFRDVFCAGNDSTFQFLQDVLDEVIALFPSKYIHVGGDECPKDRWKTCPKCQRRIREHNLKDEHELQSYFIRRIENYLTSKGRSMIGWDEILEGGLAPKATVMSWRGEQGGIDAAKQNHDVVMTPGTYVYFDHAQKRIEDSVTIGGYLPVEKVYQYEPIPAVLSSSEAAHILGAQANVWSEYIGNTSKLEYMIFPRLTALSEVLWSPKAKRDWKDFSGRLEVQFKRYELWNVNYSKAYYDIKASILPALDHKGVQWKLETNAAPEKSKIVVAVHSVSRDSMFDYVQPINISSGVVCTAILYQNEQGKPPAPTEISRVVQKFSPNMVTGKKIVLTSAPLDNFPGNGGAFGLVNGAISDRGLNSFEWLGWQDANMEATIDLDTMESISKLTVHVLEQKQGRFFQPSFVEVFGSADGKEFTTLGKTEKFQPDKDNMGYMTIEFPATKDRFLRVFAKNPGIIPEGQPNAGSRVRILVDEIGLY
ncbi:MAG TPA: family 20 glycosylhydrolase [Puia sp.]|nr:family 20 glycosylhydrolase [Puia sp.]